MRHKGKSACPAGSAFDFSRPASSLKGSLQSFLYQKVLVHGRKGRGREGAGKGRKGEEGGGDADGGPVILEKEKQEEPMAGWESDASGVLGSHQISVPTLPSRGSALLSQNHRALGPQKAPASTPSCYREEVRL